MLVAEKAISPPKNAAAEVLTRESEGSSLGRFADALGYILGAMDGEANPCIVFAPIWVDDPACWAEELSRLEKHQELRSARFVVVTTEDVELGSLQDMAEEAPVVRLVNSGTEAAP